MRGQTQEALLSMTLTLIVLTSIGVEILSIMAGERPEGTLVKASLAMAGTGLMGWVFTSVASRLWSTGTVHGARIGDEKKEADGGAAESQGWEKDVSAHDQ